MEHDTFRTGFKQDSSFYKYHKNIGMICSLVKNVYNIPALPFIVDCDVTPWSVEEIDLLPNLMQAFSIFKMFWAPYTRNAIL